LHTDTKEALGYKDLDINMLAITPDDHPVIGPLRRFPNVYVNSGHGQRSSSLAFVSAQILSDSLEQTEQQTVTSPIRYKI